MNRREFHLVEGKSNKFWAIEWEGASLTVHFGRIGTAGQTQQKPFPTGEAATREREKLILEKTKKGYREVAPTAADPAATPPTSENQAANEPAEVAPPVPATKSPASEATPARTLERSLKLAPADRFVVTWEEHELLPRPAPPSFDLENALQRLRAVGTSPHAWRNDWRKARIPAFPSREEAHFWLLAYYRCGGSEHKTTPQEIADEFATLRFDGSLPKTQIAEVLMTPWHNTADNLFGCAMTLISIEDLLDLKQHGTAPGYLIAQHARTTVDTHLAEGFRTFVLPYLSMSERAHLRRRFTGILPPIILPSFYETWPAPYVLGAMLGCHDEIAALLRTLPDSHYRSGDSWYHDHYQRPQWLVFGLADRAAVRAEFRRLGLVLRNGEQARACLALTGFDALDVLADGVCAENNKERAAAVAQALGLVSAPEGAVPALRLVLESKVPQAGQEWLAAQPLHAAVGLTPAAMGTGKLAEAARKHLHSLRRGRSEFLTAALPHLSPEQAAWLERTIIGAADASVPEWPRAELPEPLRAALAHVKPAKPPGWLAADGLPPVMIRGKRLALAEVEILLAELKAVPMGQPSGLVSALKAHADPAALDTFAWDLFERWESMGVPSKDRWALGAVGHLGGDGSVLRLTPLVRQWPGESQHQRAVYGLECLRAVGSDTALMALNGIAQKLKFKALKEKAQTLMEGIAQARGLSREQLADRIVPDCDLDERGSRVFDFGPRQFRFVLGPEMKPLVRDAAGKVRPDLPAPNASDDPEKAGSAVAAWKLLKKTLREVLKVQAERLEDAMITGRRWTPEEFRALLVRHPLMVNLARQLVFGAYGDGGQLARTFRITEDQTLADQNDDEADLPTAGQVGVVHPAALGDDAKNAWGQVLSDYEIIPPFQQMSRAINRPEPEDREETAITRYRGPKVPGIVMYGMLERSHWTRDTPADGGGFMQHSKHFPSAGLTAFIQYNPGVAMGYYDEPQQLENVYFVPGAVKPDSWGHHTNRLKIGEVDPVVLSEVLRLANAIVSKAE